MAQFFNEHEIREICYRCSLRNGMLPFGQTALRFVQTINDNSDGWAYWKAGHRAASRFLGILDALTEKSALSKDLTPADISDLKRALAPMKSLLTKHKLPALPPV